MSANETAQEAMEVDDASSDEITPSSNEINEKIEQLPQVDSTDSEKLNIEKKVDSSLDKLFQEIEKLVHSQQAKESTPHFDEKCCEVYKRLHVLSSSTFFDLHSYGKTIELSVQKADSISIEKRESLRNVGKRMWMLIRNHPELFLDHISPSKLMRMSRQNKEKVEEDKKQKNNELEENQISCSVASGFIRAVAAKLILIDHIRTKGEEIPCLISTSNQSSAESNDSSSADKNFHDRNDPSGKELEFGLKSFARAGRALLFYNISSQDTPQHSFAAYSILDLAVQCYQSITQIADHFDQNEGTKNVEEGKVYGELVTKNLEEGFDAMVLLTDAASLYKTSAVESDVDCVVKLLQELESFVSKIYILSNTNGSDIRSFGIVINRFLPCIARASYKHGNRFARLGLFVNAKACLRVSLQATDQFLAIIRSPEGKKNGEKKGVPNTSLQIQEQEMLVVSKEAFYVLSHVCQAMGQSKEAQKCLDRIEKYIDDHRDRDEELYVETLKRAGESDSEGDLVKASPSGAVSSSDLALLGPKNQDKIDIIARAQAARAKARSAETKERANLAYSRIMVHQFSLPENEENDEKSINEHLNILIGFSDKLLGTCSEIHCKDPFENEIFQLVLSAVRSIFLRRVSQSKVDGLVASKVGDLCFSNPYDLILTRYSFDVNVKYSSLRNTYIILNQMSVILTVIQKIREKIVRDDAESSNRKKIEILDNRCITITKIFFTQMELVVKGLDFSRNGNIDSVLSNPVDDLRLCQWLFEEFNSNCARAISIYRVSGGEDYKHCAAWCDILLTSLSHLESIKSKLSIKVNEAKVDESEEIGKTFSEIMAIKAHSLMMTGHLLEGLQCARSSWEKGLPNCTLSNLVILFHCSIAYESKGMSDALNQSLLEFDEAVSHMLKNASSRGGEEYGQTTDAIISIFPTLSRSCVEIEENDYRPILLGLQERWIAMFVRAPSVTFSLFDNPENRIEKPPGDTGLFTVLRAYLCNFEQILHKLSLLGDDLQFVRGCRALDSVLYSILNLLCNIRDQSCTRNNERNKMLNQEKDDLKIENTTNDVESFNPLIWDCEKVSLMIGDYQDCVWVAEQIWNIAIQIMSLEKNTYEGFSSKLFSSQLFAKAHDFALLSEEENFSSLSRGFLDHEHDEYSEKEKSMELKNCCDLSSEFSAQCLLLSVANIVDDIQQLKCDPQFRDHIKKSLGRLTLAKGEFNLTLDKDQEEQRKYVETLVTWLNLRCLVELGDDDNCASFLSSESTMAQLETMTPDFIGRQKSVDISNIKLNPENQKVDQDSKFSILSHILLCSNRAESNQMFVTVTLLLQFCAKKMKQQQCSSIYIDENNTCSLGDVQRKLIQIGSSVAEVKAIFEDINTTLEKALDHDDNNKPMYSVEECDWFSIEAYNRGVNLIFLEDTQNAERFLAIALNLLSFCGKEVESYGTEMRAAYCGAVERKRVTRGSSSTGNIMNLFDNQRDRGFSSSGFSYRALFDKDDVFHDK